MPNPIVEIFFVAKGAPMKNNPHVTDVIGGKKGRNMNLEDTSGYDASEFFSRIADLKLSPEQKEALESGVEYLMTKAKNLDPDVIVDTTKRYWKPILGTAIAAGVAGYFLTRSSKGRPSISSRMMDSFGETFGSGNGQSRSQASTKSRRAKKAKH